MTAPLALGAVVGALQECGDAQAVVVLTGDEDLKPALRSRLEALGIGLGATANAGALECCAWGGGGGGGFCTGLQRGGLLGQMISSGWQSFPVPSRGHTLARPT